MVRTPTFADDVTLLLTTPESVCSWWNMLNDFRIPAGVEVNTSKTKLNLIGWGFQGPITQNAVTVNVSKQIQAAIPSFCPIVIRQDVKCVGVILSVSDYNSDLLITAKSWQKRIENFIPFATSLRFRLGHQNLLSKIPKVNDALSRLWYLSMNCPASPSQLSKMFAMVDSIVWGTKTPLLKRLVYTQPLSSPGGLNAPDPIIRHNSLQAHWVTLFMSGKLPSCLEFYFREQMQLVLATKSNTPIQQIHLFTDAVLLSSLLPYATEPNWKLTCNNKNHLFVPLLQAITTIAQINQPPKTTAEWKSLTSKKIYRALLSNQLRNNNDAIPGQLKWVTKNSITIDWPKLWKVSAATRYLATDIHDSLFKLMIRRYVIPIGTTPDGEYSMCPYCVPCTAWEPVHAFFECKRITPTWNHVGQIILQKPTPLPISKLEIFNLCQEIPVTPNGHLNPSLAHLILLCTITEIMRWITEHKHEGQTQSQLSDSDFKLYFLSIIWLRVTKLRPPVEVVVNDDAIGIG